MEFETASDLVNVSKRVAFDMLHFHTLALLKGRDVSELTSSERTGLAQVVQKKANETFGRNRIHVKPLAGGLLIDTTKFDGNGMRHVRVSRPPISLPTQDGGSVTIEAVQQTFACAPTNHSSGGTICTGPEFHLPKGGGLEVLVYPSVAQDSTV